MYSIQYLWSKLLKKLPGASVINSKIDSSSKVHARSSVINSKFGKYSYCGYNCTIVNCEIGSYVSISDFVTIGNLGHPIEWVSTSPAFYAGKEKIPKDLAVLKYDSSEHTQVGNDVWIGERVLIKAGVTVGDGAIIGMGSVVTKDVPPYAIVAGNPAKIIKYRFSEEIIKKLSEIKWWNMDSNTLRRYAKFMDNPIKFISEVSDD